MNKKQKINWIKSWLQNFFKIKKMNLEKIYPLTIVSNRFKDKIIIFNAHNESKFITTASENEEISYNLEEWLEKEMKTYGVDFGIGDNIYSAFENFKNRKSSNKLIYPKYEIKNK